MKTYLESIAEYLLNHPGSQMIIIGQNEKSRSKSDIDNVMQAFPEDKVNEVVAYLINRGISPDRIISRGAVAKKAVRINFEGKPNKFKYRTLSRTNA